ncbi:hypothetical protein GALL_466790 [mine drainage metagenome]|uniref:Uncharacterized protein n=1 Tax=mine drainage metagenome TaxID=410659 RepID=A0A1J5Q6X8_9ZZZZ
MHARELGQHALRQPGRQLDQAVVVANRDVADAAVFQSAFVGDRTDQVAHFDAVHAADLDAVDGHRATSRRARRGARPRLAGLARATMIETLETLETLGTLATLGTLRTLLARRAQLGLQQQRRVALQQARQRRGDFQRRHVVLALVALDQRLESLQPFELARVGDALQEARDAPVVDILGAGQLHRRDLLPRRAFDGLQQVALARGHEQDRVAAASGASGATDAVHVGLDVGRDVVIDHVADAVDVEPARGHVGGHQDVDLSVLEPLHDALALVLLHVAVERGGRKATRGELVGQLLGAELGAREHDHRFEVLDFEDARQRVELVQSTDHPAALLHLHRGRRARLDRDFARVAQMAVGDGADRRRHRRRKQRDLALRRRALQHRLDVVDEAHAQHFVGFVEHQMAQRVELQRAPLEVIDHAPGRADDDVRAAPERGQLRHVALPAVNRQHMKSAAPRRVAGEGFGNLDRQLARGHQHQRLRPRQRDVDALHDRQRERRGLAGAGLRLADQVDSGEQLRDRLRLDRRRRLVTQRAQRVEQFSSEAEFGKAGDGFEFLGHRMEWSSTRAGPNCAPVRRA